MASTSLFCPTDRVQRRDDLVLRALPEIRCGMVYRPRPARIVTLNPASWRLLALCDGRRVADVTTAFAEARQQAGHARGEDAERAHAGLQALFDLHLVRLLPRSDLLTPAEGAPPHDPAC